MCYTVFILPSNALKYKYFTITIVIVYCLSVNWSAKFDCFRVNLLQVVFIWNHKSCSEDFKKWEKTNIMYILGEDASSHQIIMKSFVDVKERTTYQHAKGVCWSFVNCVDSRKCWFANDLIKGAHRLTNRWLVEI